jgi:hypothetical protein
MCATSNIASRFVAILGFVSRRGYRPWQRSTEYERLLRLHVPPYLGDVPLGTATTGRIRAWRADRLVAGIGRSTPAKTNRVLHAIFATAVDGVVLQPDVPASGSSESAVPPPLYEFH